MDCEAIDEALKFHDSMLEAETHKKPEVGLLTTPPLYLNLFKSYQTCCAVQPATAKTFPNLHSFVDRDSARKSYATWGPP